ncbi:unnamed protein product [Strongylus vulgaris]|uniref:Major facilitator superfamily (MFS) profile domain-containing protein n=1 Tax=Strongylus vulgaris TaxID=40348 RepID=A0A3P7LW07_STRVU|nr:unnamed protein product [Strongylus vulgaris]
MKVVLTVTWTPSCVLPPYPSCKSEAHDAPDISSENASVAGHNSSEIGGCHPSYDWCAETVRVPLPIYLICFIFFFGTAFPFTGSPSGALYSEILGPRRQGMMQGLHSFGGSISQFIAPIVITYLFHHSGYKYVMVVQICTIGLALLLVIAFYKRLVPLRMKPPMGKYLFHHTGYKYVMVVQICTIGLALLLVIAFYKRLVPLRMKPPMGKSTKYKNGVFYTM